jgi:hypothetical protein
MISSILDRNGWEDDTINAIKDMKLVIWIPTVLDRQNGENLSRRTGRGIRRRRRKKDLHR